jgi:hypothetical protein
MTHNSTTIEHPEDGEDDLSITIRQELTETEYSGELAAIDEGEIIITVSGKEYTQEDFILLWGTQYKDYLEDKLSTALMEMEEE